MKDNSVIFLKDWHILIESLPEDKQLVFWRMFVKYEYGRETECTDEAVRPIWNFVQKQLDKELRKEMSNLKIEGNG